MALPYQIPSSAGDTRTLRYVQGAPPQRGLDVIALQWGLNPWLRAHRLPELVADGILGQMTGAAILAFQEGRDLTADGLAGQKTQLEIVLYCAAPYERRFALPTGLVKGLVMNESLGYLGTVNDSSPGGKDLSAWQHRIGSSHLDDWDEVQDAYKMRTMAAEHCGVYRQVHDSVPLVTHDLTRFGVHKGERGRWELAALNHNWPAAVAHLARGETAWRFIEKDIVRYEDDRRVPDRPGYVSRGTWRPAHWVQQASGGRLSYVDQWCRSYIGRATLYVEW